MLKITTKLNKANGVQEFFSTGTSDNPYVNDIRINLSRGSVKNYPLTNLQAHNTDGPGNWLDGASIHSPARRAEYISRVTSEIAEKVAAAQERWEAEQNAPTVIFSENDDDDFVDEDEDDEIGCCK